MVGIVGSKTFQFHFVSQLNI